MSHFSNSRLSGIVGLVLAFTFVNAASAQPATAPAAPIEPKAMVEAKSALTSTKYKEARDLFLKIAGDNPKDYRPLHGAGIACLYLRDDKQANSLLEKASALAPVGDRALSYNFAVSDMNLGNYSRAAKTICDYLYAHPKAPDEPLADGLGALLFQTGDKNTASRVSDENRKFYSVYVAMLAQKRPGMKKWGPEWLSAADADARAVRLRDAETELGLAGQDVKTGEERVSQYRNELRNELRTAKYSNGVRSEADAQRLLNDEEKQLPKKRDRYNRAVATIDTLRPNYPQLLLPLGIDDLTPPAIEPVAAAVQPVPAVAKASDLPTSNIKVPPPQLQTDPPKPNSSAESDQRPQQVDDGPNPKGRTDLPPAGSPTLAEIVQRDFAKVKVTAEWVKLTADAKVYNPVNSKNTDQKFGTFPKELEGRSFTSVPMHNTMEEARLTFSTTTDGFVIMAIQGWGGGGRGGDWQKECVDKDGLKRQGWAQYPNIGGRAIFVRQCKAGETFSIRTDKYHPPLLVR